MIWLRTVRNWCRTKVWWQILAAKLRGHYQYYGISGNSRMLKVFYYQVMRMVHKWLNRRSQRNRWNWERRYGELLGALPSTGAAYSAHNCIDHRRCCEACTEEPDEGNLQVRFCEGR